MPQNSLDFRQLCSTLQHPSGQAVAQHVGSHCFQPSGQVLQILAACDVSLTLGLRTQLLCGKLPQLLYSSLGDPLGDAYSRRLSFYRHYDANQQPFPFLVTPNGRQPFWTANTLKVAAQETPRVWVERDSTRFSSLATTHRDCTTSQIQITQLQVTGFLHT